MLPRPRDGLNAAVVALATGLKPVNVARASGVAAAEGAFHEAALGRQAEAAEDLADANPSSPQAQFDAAFAAAEAQWQAALQLPFQTYVSAMTAADADELIALAGALATADATRGTADVTRATSVEPLNETRTNNQAGVTRAFAEAESARGNARRLSEANAYRTLDVGYAEAAQNYATAYATADKPYWVGYFGLAEEESDEELLHTRGIAYANGDLGRATGRGDSDVAWVTGFLGAEKTYRQAAAAAVKSLQTDLAGSDRDYAVARAPHDETRTNSYAAAQTTYWTQEVSAANTRRTAEALALAAFRTADYAATTDAVASIDADLDIPWTAYQAALAATKAAWWYHAGESDERTNFLALTANINTAATAFLSLCLGASVERGP